MSLAPENPASTIPATAPTARAAALQAPSTPETSSSPQEPPVCRSPSRLSTLREVRAPLEALGLLRSARRLASAPRGDGRPVMLVPGYFADGLTMAPLKRYLKYLGYDGLDWGLGRNRGHVEDDIQRLGERVQAISNSRGGEPLTLLGWSLGGVLCREVARLHPEATREVITFGTPIVGGPKYTAFRKTAVRRLRIDLPALEQDIHRRNSLGISQSVTSIFSKSDGIVDWNASVDVYNPQAKNVVVEGSHLGLGVNPEVWLAIAGILGGPGNGDCDRN